MVRSSRALGLPLAFVCLAASSASQSHTEYQVKAAFLYNFAKFVQWPSGSESEGGSFVVTVLGEDPFGAALDETLRGKSVAEAPITVRRVRRATDVGETQLLFVSESERERLPAVLKALGPRAVLTVGDMDGFAERGGVIGFRLDHDRVRLEINVAAAERSGLKISSQLLRLAEIVTTTKGG